jgi:predicted dehydrogenase
MITHDQILPSLYHLQRQGVVGPIAVCSRTAERVRKLAASKLLCRAFPGQCFQAHPAADSGRDQSNPESYRDAIADLPERGLVVVALPDQLHFEAILAALRANQHVLSVKPFVLKACEARELEREAFSRGLLVGIDYHKRFDDRNVLARQSYRQGAFGEFKLGSGRLIEKWYYRDSSFQNWCTVENSDAFTYIGCHYVDLVHFITGLLPVSVSVHGVRDRYPNGNEGFLWADARVVWNNGACLNVQTGLGLPDDAPGSNAQGLTLYCSDGNKGAWISHEDQFRGVRYSYLRKPEGAGATQFAEPNPDYFQYLDLGGPGLTPAGYGFRSIDCIVRTAVRIEETCATIDARRQVLQEIDRASVIATPGNSIYNEYVIEAGRRSLLNGGVEVKIESDNQDL